MNATPEEIAQNGAQTLETPTVGETNAANQNRRERKTRALNG